ncbi:DUF1524 domain-containing protein [Demequina sp. NBRC 110056]|uniref:GmrSD restriction endonuclease domain-containing protein n=1 Tax=Demequina sp. NBRC 110056 TaxID=1570345 RepID=UPI00117C0905|nr:DUF1524 domain-containing protein [Demequina sp. NBRC 110056]
MAAARTWWTSWPAIIVGFMLCLVPGVVLLWLRRGAPVWLKVVATAVAIPAFLGVLAPSLAAGVDGREDQAAVAAAMATPAPAVSPTPTAVPSAAPSATGATPSASASALPGPSAEQAADTDRPAYGSAHAAALRLEVKGRAPRTGYDRDEFGSGWIDVDRNGCDTRNDMLRLRLTDREMSGSCTVLSGELADPFTGSVIRVERGGASEVDVDHLVALSDAWVKGAASWEFAKRVAFANDPLNLEPVDAGANRAKGDGDAATWLPSHRAFRCDYVARQVAVKAKYEVWVTQAELDAILRVLDTCPAQELPGPGDQPVIASNVGSAPERSSERVPANTTGGTTADVDERYPYCKDLPSGLGPYYRDQDPEYAWYSDRDGDGVVCE